MLAKEQILNYDKLLKYDLDNIDKINDKKDLSKVIKKHLDNNYKLYLYHLQILSCIRIYYEKFSKYLIGINAIAFIITYALNILNIGFVILIISLIVDIIATIQSIRFSNFICDKYFGLATSIMATFIRKYADYNNIIDYDEFDDILDELSEYCIRLTQ